MNSRQHDGDLEDVKDDVQWRIEPVVRLLRVTVCR